MSQRCIIVLGMHRSGTSCLTGILQQCAVELGNVFTENPSNKKGNRENHRIMRLNDSVLNENGGAWDQPARVDHWTTEQERERDAIIRQLRAGTKGHWGFKDPRTLFTLPFWSQAIPKPKFIGTLRHPLRVAYSLQQRDYWTIQQGMDLWRQYNQRLFRLAELHHFPIIDFDLPDEQYLDDVGAKLESLGIRFTTKQEDHVFFRPELRNQTKIAIQDAPIPKDISALYAALLSISHGFHPGSG